MRKTVPVLFLIFCLWPGGPSEARSELQVEAPFTVSGTPLEIHATVSGLGSGRRLVASVSVDGKVVAESRLPEGKSELVFPDVRLRSGTRTVVLRAGSIVEEIQIRVLPGWLSLVPPILAIGLALIFRDVLIALFLGVFGGALILTGWDPFAAFGRSIDTFVVPALADTDHASIIIFTSLLGGMVGLITKGGGTHGIIELLTPYATTSRRGQLATWMMGLTVFFDDYANTLIVGPTMRPITDKLKISREKLAYIVDSTAAPVVCLFPISTWVGFEIGLVGDAFDQLGLSFDPYAVFVASIPYRFYPLFALILVLCIVASTYDFGAMRRAERRARLDGHLLAPDAKPIADYSSQEVEPPADAPKRAINALLPIVTVVAVTIIGLYLTGVSGTAAEGIERGDASTGEWLRTVLANANSYNALLWSSLAGALVALALPLAQRILKLQEAIGALLAGIKAMFLALLVLILAWSLSAVCGELDTAQYLVGLTQQSVAPWVMPALTFVLAAAVAFATGSSWGTMGILEPLVIPIAHSLLIASGQEVGSGPYMAILLGTIASVLSGAVWGDHCSPISDTTILSSMASGCDHIAHVRTQLPYALGAGGLAAAVGCIPVALGVPVFASLFVGMVLIVAFVFGYGRQRELREQRQAEASGI